MASYLFVGLGNPGQEYVQTRHNIGFMVVDAFAGRRNCPWNSRPREPYTTSATTYAQNTVTLLKPLTYMNSSGTAVRSVMKASGIPASNVIVVVDEYNFPTGRVHLRKGGSDGGHNGLTSVIEELGTPDFWRLRCGISRDFGPGELVRYVLSPFGAHEREALDGMIAAAVTGLEKITMYGPDRAMQMINTVTVV